jgi:ribulose-phosphate 3-epimerase
MSRASVAGDTPEKKVSIFPSIMAGDVGRLVDEVHRIEETGVAGIHIDVMDGHFVPNLGFSTAATTAIRRATDLFLEVHLMVYNPLAFIEPFVQAGANRLIFHFEATEDIEDTLRYIRSHDIQAGLAFSPDTSESLIPRFLPLCDLVLLMTVRPGFGGQPFLPEVLHKVRYLREVCNQIETSQKAQQIVIAPTPFLIEVDGGINQESARQCVDAGANLLVVGTYLFQQENVKATVRSLQQEEG